MWKSFVLELSGEWSEFADECIAQFPSTENDLHLRPNRFAHTHLSAKRSPCSRSAVGNEMTYRGSSTIIHEPENNHLRFQDDDLNRLVYAGIGL